MNYLRLAAVPLTDKERDINIFLNPGKHSQEKVAERFGTLRTFITKPESNEHDVEIKTLKKS